MLDTNWIPTTTAGLLGSFNACLSLVFFLKCLAKDHPPRGTILLIGTLGMVILYFYNVSIYHFTYQVLTYFPDDEKCKGCYRDAIDFGMVTAITMYILWNLLYSGFLIFCLYDVLMSKEIKSESRMKNEREALVGFSLFFPLSLAIITGIANCLGFVVYLLWEQVTTSGFYRLLLLGGFIASFFEFTR